MLEDGGFGGGGGHGGGQWFGLPAEGAGAEHGGVGFLEFGKKNVDFVLEAAEHVFLHGLTHGTEQHVARLGESAEEHECFRRREHGEVSEGFAEYAAGVLKDVFSELIALGGSVVNVFRGDVIHRYVAEQ